VFNTLRAVLGEEPFSDECFAERIRPQGVEVCVAAV